MITSSGFSEERRGSEIAERRTGDCADHFAAAFSMSRNLFRRWAGYVFIPRSIHKQHLIPGQQGLRVLRPHGGIVFAPTHKRLRH